MNAKFAVSTVQSYNTAPPRRADDHRGNDDGNDDDNNDDRDDDRRRRRGDEGDQHAVSQQVRGQNHKPVLTFARPRGVTVSTLHSESSDRGSNPREASSQSG